MVDHSNICEYSVILQISAEKYSLIQQKEEQERLKSQIVQSPQKLQVLIFESWHLSSAKRKRI